MKTLLVAYLVLAPCIAVAEQPSRQGPPPDPARVQAVQNEINANLREQIAILRQIAADEHQIAADERCIRIRASGGSC